MLEAYITALLWLARVEPPLLERFGLSATARSATFQNLSHLARALHDVCRKVINLVAEALKGNLSREQRDARSSAVFPQGIEKSQ